jgi:hypothetical protein
MGLGRPWQSVLVQPRDREPRQTSGYLLPDAGERRTVAVFISGNSAICWVYKELLHVV